MSSGKARILLTAEGAQQVLSELQKVTQALNAATAGRAFEGAAQRRQRAADSVSRHYREQARAVERSERDQRRAIEKTARAAERAARERKQLFGQRALTGVSIAAGLGVPIGPALNLGFAAHSGGPTGLALAAAALSIGLLGKGAVEASKGIVRLGLSALKAAEAQGNVATTFVEGKSEFEEAFGRIGRVISEESKVFEILTAALKDNAAGIESFTVNLVRAANALARVGASTAGALATKGSILRRGIGSAIGFGIGTAFGAPGAGLAVGGALPPTADIAQDLFFPPGQRTGRSGTARSDAKVRRRAEQSQQRADREAGFAEQDRNQVKNLARERARQRSAELNLINKQVSVVNKIFGLVKDRLDVETRILELDRKRIAKAAAAVGTKISDRAAVDPVFAVQEKIKNLALAINRGLDPKLAVTFLEKERLTLEAGLTGDFRSKVFTGASALRDQQQAATLSRGGPSQRLKEIKDQEAKANIKKIKLAEELLATNKAILANCPPGAVAGAGVAGP